MSADQDESRLRVPTRALEVDIHYFDERPMSGRIFLPATAQRHGGPMRPEEWMNQPALFFPFLPRDGAGTIILNKRYVVVLTLPAGQSEQESPWVGIRRGAAIECGSLKLTGIVLIDMPETQSRLLDFINQPTQFLTLLDGGKHHLVQKRRITSISESEEPQA